MLNSGFMKAAAAGFVVLFALGFLTYGLLLADFFAANAVEGVTKEPPGFALIMVGELVYAVFLTMVLGWKGVSNTADGFKAGLIVAFMITVSVDLIFLGAFNVFTTTGVVADVIVQSLRVGAAGAVIGMLLGGGSASEAPPRSLHES